MSEPLLVEVYIQIELADADAEELSRLSRRLREDLLEQDGVAEVQPVSAGEAPPGAKMADWNLLGEWMVKLGVAAIPGVFEMLKKRAEKAPASAPLKIKVKVGRRSAEVEYDPARTTPEQVQALVAGVRKSLTP
ncbi:MAG: hypothetical protein AAB658_17095 [Chloroflexota bacterium]